MLYVNETSSSELGIQPQILELTGGVKLGPELGSVSPVYPLLPDLPMTRSFWFGKLCPLSHCGCHVAEEEKSTFIKKPFHTGHHAGVSLRTDSGFQANNLVCL